MTRPSRRAGLLVGLAVVLVHGRSVFFGFTDLDDRDLIVGDSAFLAGGGSLLNVFRRSYMHIVDAEHAYYRPLVTLSYAIDARWGGVRASPYHLTNVGLHAIASLLFFALLRRLDFGRTVAACAALVFAVHPAVASAVAWVPGRNDSLCAVFVLASWLFFVADIARPSWASRLLHIGCFWLALLSKETALVVPVVCGLHRLLAEGTRIRGRPSLPTLVIAVGWACGIAGRMMAHALPSEASARELLHHLPLLATSLSTLAVPVDSSLIGAREDQSAWPGVVAVALIAAATRYVPGVRFRIVAMGAAAFVSFLAPALAVPGDLILESRLYLPACGAFLAGAEIVRAIAPERRTLIAFSAAGLAALGAMTVAYEGTFRDRRTFARNAVASAPHAPMAHFCLARSFQIDGDADRALAEYRLAAALGATYSVHNNIAVLYMARARWTEAERELREELAIDPRSAPAHRNLAAVLRREDRLEEATSADQRAGSTDGEN